MINSQLFVFCADARLLSIWLRKTNNGGDRLSRWVWVIGVMLLLVCFTFRVLIRTSKSNHL
jgi:hypothetical protein